MAMSWHVLPQQERSATLVTHAERGLDSAAAAARLARQGPYELVEAGTKSP